MTIPELIQQLRTLDEKLPQHVDPKDPQSPQLLAARGVINGLIGTLYCETTYELLSHDQAFFEQQIASLTAQSRRN